MIANALPIIVLAKIQKLDLLLSPGRILMIPEAVAKEILNTPAQDAARVALESGWGSAEKQKFLILAGPKSFSFTIFNIWSRLDAR